MQPPSKNLKDAYMLLSAVDMLDEPGTLQIALQQADGDLW
jgi:hypothetical protein